MRKSKLSRLAGYVAYLYKQRDVWRRAGGHHDEVKLFSERIETIKDICSILECRDAVWREVVAIYDFTKEN